MRRRGVSPATRNEKHAVAYVRVSTEEQAEGNLSLPSQLDAIRRWARERDLTLMKEYVEPGASATDDNRRVFQSMLGDVQTLTSTVGSIIVTHTSRFMRNATKARIRKEQLKKAGVRVVSIQQELADDATGRFAEGMFELVDQLESEMNGARTRAAMVENARQGNFNGSRPPFGYRIEKTDTSRKLVVDVVEADIVRDVFQRYISGQGAKSVAAELNAGAQRYRGKQWTIDSVLRIVSDTTYIGTYYWGRLDSHKRTLRPREEWIAIEVEPIVAPEVFRLAQEAREDRDPERNPGRASSSPLLLAGLIKCGFCGATGQLEAAGQVSPEGKQKYRYYGCRSFIRSGKQTCVGFRIRTEVLEQIVLNHVAERLFTEEHCRDILRSYVEEQGLLRRRREAERRRLVQEHAELERRLASWYEKVEKQPEVEDLALDRIRELKRHRDEAAKMLAGVERAPSVPPYLYKPETIAAFQAKLRQALLSADQGLARRYLKRLLAKVVVTRDEIVIEARPDTALEMLAAGGKPPDETAGTIFLSHVVGWRPRYDSNVRPTV